MKKVINKLGFELLYILRDLGELGYDIVTTPYGKLRIGSEPSYYRSVNSLVKNGLVTKVKTGRKNKYSLTSKGIELIKDRRRKSNKRSDGFSSMIIFDIPEDMSRQRTIFRRFLVRNGYTLIQKSVLISLNFINKEIKDLARELNLEKYITSFSVKSDIF